MKKSDVVENTDGENFIVSHWINEMESDGCRSNMLTWWRDYRHCSVRRTVDVAMVTSRVFGRRIHGHNDESIVRSGRHRWVRWWIVSHCRTTVVRVRTDTASVVELENIPWHRSSIQEDIAIDSIDRVRLVSVGFHSIVYWFFSPTKARHAAIPIEVHSVGSSEENQCLDSKKKKKRN